MLYNFCYFKVIFRLLIFKFTESENRVYTIKGMFDVFILFITP